MKTDLKHIHRLHFSGGGLLGIGHVGVIRYLETYTTLLDNKDIVFSGTSVGSIIAFFLSINLQSSDIMSFLFRNVDLIKNTLNLNDLFTIKNTLNVCSFQSVHELIHKITQLKNKDYNTLVFKDVPRLQIHVTCLTKHTFVLFNHKTHPDMLISKAIQMSCAIPVLFKPIEYEGELYCDGSLYQDIGDIDSYTLYFMLRYKYISSSFHNEHMLQGDFISILTTLLTNFYNIYMDGTTYEKFHDRHTLKNIIRIVFPKDIKRNDNFTTSSLFEMIHIGYESTKDHFKKQN